MSEQRTLEITDEKQLSTVEAYRFSHTPIKGYPELRWQGKRPFTSTQYYPAQLRESYGDEVEGWMNRVYLGDNLQITSHLLKQFRGSVQLAYIDPPYDSKADYKKKISVHGKSTKNDYSAFEEKQYSDIWTNDAFLQYLFERIILLKELLSETGTIWVHCDYHRAHHLRIILDEVFGPDNFMNEVIWQRTDPHNDAKKRLGFVHDNIFWYAKARKKALYNWEAVTTDLTESAEGEYCLVLMDDGRIVDYDPDKPIQGRRFKLENATYKGTDQTRRFDWRGVRPSDNRVWVYESAEEMDEALAKGELHLRDPRRGSTRCVVRFLEQSKGIPLQTIWTDCGRMKGGSDYPTRKPEGLLERIIRAGSNPGDLVVDTFMGSGTTPAVAMKLGRRFIASDINIGAVQATIKRLAKAALQLQRLTAQMDMLNDSASPGKYFTGFAVLNVNHYEFFRNPAQAKDLIIEALEIQPLTANTLYDGEKDGRLVKIMPVNRITTKADLNELLTGFDYKAFQRRSEQAPNKPVESIMLVCMGHEPDLAAHLERECQGFKLDVEVLDILRDKAKLEFKRESEAEIEIKNGVLRITSFYPMSLLQKLSLMRESVDDWRELTESVMIDWNYDGAVLEPKLIDAPGSDALVKGEYPVPPDAGTVRVKITDLLSETLEKEATNG